MLDREVIAIADPHLGVVPGDIEEMGGFLDTLVPGDTDLLFLGDLFHIWAGPEKYHTEPIRIMLARLGQYRKEGGRVFLVVGNRDAFLMGHPENSRLNGLPFDGIHPEFAMLTGGSLQMMAVHGDTINRQNVWYLRWRRMLRSKLLERLFNLLPAERVKRIMFRLEADLQQFSPEYRQTFPVVEWDHFVDRAVAKHAPDLLLCGHFHPMELIVKKADNTTALVVPDWGKEGAYLRVGRDLNWNLYRFRASV